MSDYTEEDLADLTEAERAALQEDDGSGGEPPGESEPNENEGQDDQQTNEGAAGDGNGADPATGGNAAAAAAAEPAHPAGAAADEQGAAPSQPAQPAPVFVAEAPADADAKLAEIASKKEEVIAKFDDGDITAKEMQAEMDALGKQERAIEREVDRAQLAAEMKRQQDKNQWDADCKTFLDAHSAHYKGEANQEVFVQLNDMIKAFATMSANAGISGPELLARAHKAVMAVRGTPVVEAKDDPAPGKTIKTTERAIPPSLHAVPAAEQTDTAGGKWAALDRLSPDKLEDALMNLPESERQAYLAAR